MDFVMEKLLAAKKDCWMDSSKDLLLAQTYQLSIESHLRCIYIVLLEHHFHLSSPKHRFVVSMCYGFAILTLALLHR